MKQFLISIDQVINTLIWAEGEGFGMADETISARCWRLQHRERTWGLAMRAIDTLFSPFEKDHCMRSYESEIRRKQLPMVYGGLDPRGQGYTV